VLAARAQFDDAGRRELENDVANLISEHDHLRATALRRVPRDERDWPTVAAALALGALILTADGDFLGCGVAVWTVDTLIAATAADTSTRRDG
jgi:predicted nuclease of predicted toxin-antitoxin system